MSDVWRIFVVEGDESLNRNIVNSLSKDGYDVQGVLSGADAVRVLWSEVYDVAICNLKTPGAEGLELLQWLRAYRPNTHIILIGEATGDSGDMRMQALGSGAASYLEKPLDIHLLKEELRRLLQQTGFSANLNSFDLLDVIQIINMSRKSIALLVNTGLEEHGILRFKNGELTWSEYGLLRGEEAFFALAAHKNGTVIHQPWNDHIASNVTQPLSRLIFQALQYRTKYANKQQFTGEQEVVTSGTPITDEIDDRPFAFLEELDGPLPVSDVQEWGMHENEQRNEHIPEYTKEWWEKTGSIPEVKRSVSSVTRQFTQDEAPLPNSVKNSRNLDGAGMTPTASHNASVGEQIDLPSWLTDQPTASSLPVIPHTTASNKFPAVPLTPLSPASSPNWQYPQESVRNESALSRETHDSSPNTMNTRASQRSSPVWQLSDLEQSQPRQESIPPTRSRSRGGDTLPLNNDGPLSQSLQAANAKRLKRPNYNYASLVAALQTLGYAISGFEAAAIVSMEGQPVAQVSIDDRDLSPLCKMQCLVLKSALQAQDDRKEDPFEDLVIESRSRRVMLRIVGNEKETFLVLITSRDADLSASRDIINNIESAISIALRG